MHPSDRVASRLEGGYTLLWALSWSPGEQRRRARWLQGILVAAIALLAPWVGAALLVLLIAETLRRPLPQACLLHVLYERTSQQFWLDVSGRRHPLRARWLDQQRIRLASEPFVVYADEFSAADFARLRRCSRGLVTPR